MPFSYATRSDGSIVISYHTAPVTILRGRSAERFATRIADADAAASQQLMARATGSVQARKRAGREALADSVRQAESLTPATRFVFLLT